MAHDPIVELEGGQRYRLVEAHRVLRWDLETARAQLRAAVAQDDALLEELVRFAAELGPAPVDGDEAIESIARAIAAGELVPWEMQAQQPSGLRPVVSATDPDDWSDVRPLSELREDPEPAVGWVSIEVLDHSGVPYAGLELTMVHGDGRRDGIVLDDLGRHTARDVATPGRTTVYWPPRLARVTSTLLGLRERLAFETHVARALSDGCPALALFKGGRDAGHWCLIVGYHIVATSSGARRLRWIVNDPARSAGVQYPCMFAAEAGADDDDGDQLPYERRKRMPLLKVAIYEPEGWTPDHARFLFHRPEQADAQ